MAVKLEKIGDKFVMVLSDEIISILEWTHGDAYKVSVEGGELRVSRAVTKHERAMKIADEVMDEYREVFEALAKS